MSLRDRYQSRRIDARPRNNNPEAAAGMYGLHRATNGAVIGGYTAEGQAMGTKAGNRAPQFTGLRRWQQMNPGAKLATEKTGAEIGKPVKNAGAPMGVMAAPAMGAAGPVRPGAKGPETMAAGGDLLAKRKALFEDMKKAGRGGLGTGLRQRAAELGVTDSGWNRAVGRLGAAPAMLARPGSKAPASPAPAPEPAAPAITMAGQNQDFLRGQYPSLRKPINPNARIVGQG